MTPFERALQAFSADGQRAVADAHIAAIANGGNFTGTTYETECTFTPQDLLCLAGNAAVDVAMISQIFEAASESVEHARLLKEASAGLARLSARALEIHARDTGYDPQIWISAAIDETEIVMIDDTDPLFEGLRTGGESVTLARKSAASIHAALACAPADRMGVPGHISAALGAAVALYMIADSAERDG